METKITEALDSEEKTGRLKGCIVRLMPNYQRGFVLPDGSNRTDTIIFNESELTNATLYALVIGLRVEYD